MRHGERLARPRDAHQRLKSLVLIDPASKLLDRLRLIALRLERTYHLECCHLRLQFGKQLRKWQGKRFEDRLSSQCLVLRDHGGPIGTSENGHAARVKINQPYEP